jgi:Domain of unknown function (DUF1876)
MATTKKWKVKVYLIEEDDKTTAEAVLKTDKGIVHCTTGYARRNPVDREVPQIGDELAASRALGALAHHLLEVSVADVETNVGAAAVISQ